MSDDGEVALWRQASSDLLALVVDAELTEMLGYRLERELALEALAARAELADRMCRHRWLAMEAARRAWAAWEEIDLTVGLPPGGSRREYELVLDRQKALGLVGANRTDPGPADR